MDDLYKYKAKVERVIDGDTIVVKLDAGFQISTVLRLRLNDVDTPERGEPNYKEASQFTHDHLHGKEVIVQTHKGDAFGRYLADVWYQVDNRWTHFNTELKFSGLLKEHSKWNNTF